MFKIKRILFMCMIVFVLILLYGSAFIKNKSPAVCHAAQCQDEENVISDDYIVSDDYKDIDRIVKRETGINISYGKIMQSVLDDKDNSGYVKKLLIYISDVIYSEKKNVAHVLALCIASALIRSMTPLFNEKQLKETAAGVISISLITMLLSVFMGAYNLARDSVEALINIYKSICMTFFPAVCAAGLPISAAGYYQIVIWMMTVADIGIKNILMNANRIYVCVSLCDCIDSEPHFLRLCNCMQKVIKWCGYTMLTFFMGLNGIKSILNPLKDNINTSYIYKAVSIIPGIGDAASALSQTVIASSSLIKNTMGIAAVVVLTVCMLFPVVKLVTLSCIFHAIAAVMEPVADKRIIKAVAALGTAISSLTYLVVIALVLFVLTIVMICAVTS
ncbi:MAG: stage III sporulation protein AE [Eubacterium sp.]|nr:stage III sporulation protein AE [Eubacterium sp.]